MFSEELNRSGFNAYKRRIVDATVAKDPRQRFTMEEERRKKYGEIRENEPRKARQKDTDAGTASSERQRSRPPRPMTATILKIWRAGATAAAMSGAGTAHQPADNRQFPKKNRFRPQNTLSKPERTVKANRRKSKVRVRVKRVFAQQKRSSMFKVLTDGLQRAKARIMMDNLVFNMSRFILFMKSKAADRIRPKSV